MKRRNPNSVKLSVLIVVEDRLLGGDLAATLEEIGYGAILASVQSALAEEISPAPDLVLIDTAGIEQTDGVAAGNEIGLQLGRPVVYLVDDGDQASRVDERASGAPSVMWPFPPNELDDALQRARLALP